MVLSRQHPDIARRKLGRLRAEYARMCASALEVPLVQRAFIRREIEKLSQELGEA